MLHLFRHFEVEHFVAGLFARYAELLLEDLVLIEQLNLGTDLVDDLKLEQELVELQGFELTEHLVEPVVPALS